jgi:integrase
MNIRKRTWTWKGSPNRAYILDGRVGGRRIRKQFPTRQDAERYRDRLIRERNAEVYGALVDDAITFADFTKIYFEKKPWRTDTYRERADWSVKVLTETFGEIRLAAITPTMIDEYTRTRLKTRAPSTVRQELATLSDICRWAVKLRYADRNPCRDVERPALPEKQDEMPEYLTPEQFGDLIVQAGRDVPLYEFAVFTGLRATELLALTSADIRDGVIVVRRGKGRKQRIVPIVPQAEAALAKVPRRLKEPRIFWWVHSRYQLYDHLQKRLTAASMKDQFTFHSLRHTFGAWCSQSGVDLRVISAAMGHSSVRTTERLYAHLSPDYRRLELHKLGTVFSVGTTRAQEERKLSET